MNKVLVIGRGGREHALAWTLARSPQVKEVFVAPGNHGMKGVATCVDINENDFDRLIEFAKKESITLTVVGPEEPLSNGIADRFIEAGLTVFGPKANAAIIEGSKAFSKELFKKYNIPSAAYATFSDHEKALEYVEKSPLPIVLKSDGLAAGKGVIIAETHDEAKTALKELMLEGRFGKSSSTVVIEEFMEGDEFSCIGIVNGEHVYLVPLAQDHKRAYDGDQGPNTGGMGAYSPTPKFGREGDFKNILTATAKAMVAEGRPFTGFLFAGIMMTKDGPKIIEYNARFGDPEAEVILPRLESDFFQGIMDVLDGKAPDLRWSEGSTAGVMLASKGYPGDYVKGVPIEGLDNLKADTLVFHCGTDYKDGQYVTNGGRVLIVVRKAESLADGLVEVYREIEKIKCENLFCRKDIGAKG